MISLSSSTGSWRKPSNFEQETNYELEDGSLSKWESTGRGMAWMKLVQALSRILLAVPHGTEPAEHPRAAARKRSDVLAWRLCKNPSVLS